MQPFVDFLERSACRLEHLIMKDATLSEEAMVEYLSLPALRSLERLTVCENYQRMLDFLTFSDTAHNLPCLQSIDMQAVFHQIMLLQT